MTWYWMDNILCLECGLFGGEDVEREFELVPHSQLNLINVFLVRMAERSVHLHRDLELGLLIDGSTVLYTEHCPHRLEKGDIYLINPMQPHEFASDGAAALILAVQISPQLGEQFFPDAANIRFETGASLRETLLSKPGTQELLSAVCVQLSHSYLSRGKNYEFGCLSLVSVLLQQLTGHLPWSVLNGEDSVSTRQRAERIFAITDYIERNFKRKLLLSEIAHREKLSLSYLSHFFKDTMGITFQEYLNQTRFDYACMLLENTDRTILDISISSGFSDVRYFNRMFYEHFGVSPSSCRSEIQSRAARTESVKGSSQHIFPPDEALALLAPSIETSRRCLEKITLYEFLKAL